MTRYAAIDCGTNSTRMLAVDHDGSTLARDLIVTRLGQGVDATGKLAPEAIERARVALERYRAVLDQLEITNIGVFATSAARDAENSEAFMTVATEAIGVRPTLLSGEEEGLMTFAGATADLPPGTYVVLDIGGGSTEVVWGDDAGVAARSMDVGAVRLTERLLTSDPYDPAELADAFEITERWLTDIGAELPIATSSATLVGVAGTVTTVAAMDLGLAAYDREAIHGHRMTRDRVEELFRSIAQLTQAERLGVPGIPSDRADVIVAGLIVLLATMRHFDFTVCVVSEADNLDGQIAQMRKSAR